MLAAFLKRHPYLLNNKVKFPKQSKPTQYLLFSHALHRIKSSKYNSPSKRMPFGNSFALPRCAAWIGETRLKKQWFGSRNLMANMKNIKIMSNKKIRRFNRRRNH